MQQLRDQGYADYQVSRTLLGLVRVVAFSQNGERREIVFDPATGEILRNYYSGLTDEGDAPRIFDRSGDDATPRAASSPSATDGNGDVPRPYNEDDGDRGHGNDVDGLDSNNPGRGHGNDGTPGGGNSGNNNGQGNASGGGGGNGNKY